MEPENNAPVEVAPQTESTPVAEVAPAQDGAQPPAQAPAENGEKILDKFNSVDDLVKSYTELESKFTKATQQLREQPPVIPTPVAVDTDLPFDTETVQGLEAWYTRRREADRVKEFVTKHREELADPILAGTTQRLIAEANAEQRHLDQEQALEMAKKMLSERIAPQVKQAEEDAYQEASEIARKKTLAGAVGTTSVATPKVDPNNLLAKEYAEYHNLPRR